MSDMTNPPNGPEDNDPRAVAAEYVLGLLTEAEGLTFEAQMADDAALRDEVAFWSDHFANLADAEVAPVKAPAQLKSRLQAQLFAEKRPSFWSQIWPYGLGGIAAAVVLWLAVTSGVLVIDDGALRSDLVAELAPATDDGRVTLVANVDTEQAAVRVVRTAGAPPEGRVFELWLIAGDAAPVSLGLLGAEDSTVLAVPQELLAQLPGALLAVSDEPPGGSPTGAPTGTVQAAGALTAS